MFFSASKFATVGGILSEIDIFGKTQVRSHLSREEEAEMITNWMDTPTLNLAVSGIDNKGIVENQD